MVPLIPPRFTLDIRYKIAGVAETAPLWKRLGSNYHPPRKSKEWTKWAGLHSTSRKLMTLYPESDHKAHLSVFFSTFFMVIPAGETRELESAQPSYSLRAYSHGSAHRTVPKINRNFERGELSLVYLPALAVAQHEAWLQHDTRWLLRKSKAQTSRVWCSGNTEQDAGIYADRVLNFAPQNPRFDRAGVIWTPKSRHRGRLKPKPRVVSSPPARGAPWRHVPCGVDHDLQIAALLSRPRPARAYTPLHILPPHRPRTRSRDAKGDVSSYAGREGIGTYLRRCPTSGVDMHTEGTHDRGRVVGGEHALSARGAMSANNVRVLYMKDSELALRGKAKYTHQNGNFPLPRRNSHPTTFHLRLVGREGEGARQRTLCMAVRVVPAWSELKAGAYTRSAGTGVDGAACTRRPRGGSSARVRARGGWWWEEKREMMAARRWAADGARRPKGNSGADGAGVHGSVCGSVVSTIWEQDGVGWD
ncbi:hypothetical protein FB451DRAFT_1189651 [Mycena latifolia]|nr:hypothetical protein FB451DRAFT_1189651 [Mycena latifolia]